MFRRFPSPLLICAWAVLPVFSHRVQAGETLVPIDLTQVDVRRGETCWQLWSGSKLIKDLGNSEVEAREVVGVIRQLRLNQRGTIGTREPVIEYWLADGQPPDGLIPAYRLLPLDGSTLRVEQIAGQWCLREDGQLWFNFGRHETDARQALEVIQRYGFNRIGYVGQAETVMIYFMKTASERATPRRLHSSVVFSQREAMYLRQLTAPSLAVMDPATGEEKLPFDWRHAEVKHDGQKWKLMAGRECLADFGSDSWAAREALQAVQHYRFTERCLLGDSATPVTYYLVNGQAPHGLRFGMRNTPFHADRLKVSQVAGRWMLCEDSRPILQGGDNEAEAKRTLQAIQKYQFDNVCSVGADEKGLRFLARER
jgi:hypothetical protein